MRLFSSIEAFHRTLKAHRRALEKAAAEPHAAPTAASLELLLAQPDAEDDRSELAEDEVETEEEQAVEAATAAGGGKPSPREVDLVTRMEELAERSRRLPDARVRWLVDWIRREMCPKLPALGMPSVGAPAEWLPRREKVKGRFPAFTGRSSFRRCFAGSVVASMPSWGIHPFLAALPSRHGSAEGFSRGCSGHTPRVMATATSSPTSIAGPSRFFDPEVRSASSPPTPSLRATLAPPGYAGFASTVAKSSQPVGA
jgi:hypothetical protein